MLIPAVLRAIGPGWPSWGWWKLVPPLLRLSSRRRRPSGQLPYGALLLQWSGALAEATWKEASCQGLCQRALAPCRKRPAKRPPKEPREPLRKSSRLRKVAEGRDGDEEVSELGWMLINDECPRCHKVVFFRLPGLIYVYLSSHFAYIFMTVV